MSKLSYRNYKEQSRMAVDIETYDPQLGTKGNGVYRKDGYICGVAFSDGIHSEYYDINHFDTLSEDKEKNLKYIEDQLSGYNEKVGANFLYDLDWLENGYNISVNGKIHDVQIAEPLIDEYRVTYSLDSLGLKYLEKGKLKDPLKEWCEKENLKLLKNDSPLKYLYKMPKDLINHYSPEDARLTYRVFEKQEKELKAQNLTGIYNLEVALIPLLLQMRKQGVRLKKEAMSPLGLELADVSYDIQEELNNMAGFKVNPNSSPDLEKLFKKLKLPIVYNEPTALMKEAGKTIGNPSFNKKILEKVDSPIAKKILELRHIKTIIGLFLIPYQDFLIGDRLHCNFNQLRSDNYGTVSGRFSSTKPNLQQVSGKKEEDALESHQSSILSGQIIRKLFIPEDNCHWLKLDWNQIEYRLIAHYAMGEGAEEIRRRYIENPETDYHSELGELTGIDDRKIIKTLNFGSAYGMGPKTMSREYGWSLTEAYNVYELYHSRVPFVRETSNRVGTKAKRVGYIRTVLNRRARLKSRDKAYVMFNRLIQGSAADLMKKAMVDAYNAGIFNVLHPHITVHDELDCSMPKTKEGLEAGQELKHLMEICLPLKVPIYAEAEIGENWGELTKVKDITKYEHQPKLFN